MLLEANVLARALQSIILLVPKRSTLPVLEHVLLEPSGTGKLRLAVTDLATRAEVEIPAIDPTATGLSVRPLLEFAAGARDASIKDRDRATARHLPRADATRRCRLRPRARHERRELIVVDHYTHPPPGRQR